MTSLLPVFSQTGALPFNVPHEEYYAVRRDEKLFLPAIEAICRRHDLPTEDLHKYPEGAMVVFAVGREYAIKLFPPIWPHHYRDELASYRAIYGKLGVETPQVIATEQLEGWSYIVMSQLHGEEFSAVWPTLPQQDKQRLIGDLADIVARLHALPLDGLEDLATDWPAYTSAQVKKCVEQQREGKLAEYWLEQIPAYLERQIPHIPTDFDPVLLNTELGGFFTFAQRDAQWVFAGLGDFADAFVGHSEYEFAAVGIFISGGNRELFRAFLLRYGYTTEQLTPKLSNRIMTYALLHRYSNLTWYLEEVPPPPNAKTLEDLALHFFAC